MSTKDEQKKKIERHQLDRFRASMSSFPMGEIETTEEPDFLVRTTQHTIGIELVDLFWETPIDSSPAQAQESLRAKIARRAADKYSQSGHPPLNVAIFFNPVFTLRGQDVDRLSTAISDLIAQNIPSEGQAFEEKYDWENRSYFPEEVDTLSVRNLPNSDKNSFYSPHAAFIPTLAPGDLERTLALKESKVKNYRKKCDVIWLLINSDNGQLSTYFEFNESALEKEFETSFDRVYFLRHTDNSVYELNKKL